MKGRKEQKMKKWVVEEWNAEYDQKAFDRGEYEPIFAQSYVDNEPTSTVGVYDSEEAAYAAYKKVKGSSGVYCFKAAGKIPMVGVTAYTLAEYDADTEDEDYTNEEYQHYSELADYYEDSTEEARQEYLKEREDRERWLYGEEDELAIRRSRTVV